MLQINICSYLNLEICETHILNWFFNICFLRLNMC